MSQTVSDISVSYSNIYADIAKRTNGDIYIGVVGPVRTGKSTFIKKFMESLVLPNIQNAYDKERARDEMPQSAAGKTVMTTEPKFVPDEAVEISLSGNAVMRVKMIDCVGYIVPAALGHFENGEPRMVSTPWSNKPIPFEEAAETGTRKVIRDHSTIGIVVTTDGTIGEIDRNSYIDAEERVIKELKEINKPFAIILNSAHPESSEAADLAYKLEEKYGVPVALINCLEINSDDIRHILELILLEFPVTELSVELPAWISAIDENHQMNVSLKQAIIKCGSKIKKTGDIAAAFNEIETNDYVEDINIEEIDLGNGKARIIITLPEQLYYNIIGEITGFDISDEENLISLLCELAGIKKKYDRVSSALAEVNETGYGIVTPDINDLSLEEPEIIRQSGSYGVKLKASGASIHMIKANIQTEVNPIVGTEQQSEDLVKFLLREFEEEPNKLWESNIFGKTLHELVSEGLHTKLSHMPVDARAKLSETLQRIINEGSGGLICILL